MTTHDELVAIGEEERAQQAAYGKHIHVCTAASCLSMGSDKVLKALSDEVADSPHRDGCKVKGVGCMGLCAAGPLVTVEPDNVLYEKVQPADAGEIVASLDTAPVERLRVDTSLPFFARQEKIVLRNSGAIDPERIEEYIAVGGYQALSKALTTMAPEDVIQEIMTSGLRGRGGGGYPTGLKWVTVAKAESDEKYVICNGDEGDPGAFMDRAVLESDPHRIIEGMAIAGYAVGAQKGYIYVRAEYPLAIERLKKAIRQAGRMGILGPNIFNTPFSFTIEIRLGAGAFVCGEETALMASIEGRRGTPRPRPPYPADYGLWGKPTSINNVETLANVAPIILNGGAWFASIGTEKSTGTKVFALAGQINHVGLIEVPMGMTLHEIIFEVGGGMPAGRQFKAVQTGGPSGGCIPARYLDTPVDYDSLRALGSIMGSGGMIVMDDTSSMVDVARYFMEFSMDESCGKCIPCRVGTTQVYHLLSKVLDEQATAADVEMLEELCDLLKNTSLCGLGQAAPNPVLATLKYFRDEYDALLLDQPSAPVASDLGANHHD